LDGVVRRLLRVLGKVLLAMLLLVLGLLVAGVAPVDRRPVETLPCYGEARQRLSDPSAAGLETVRVGELRAGFGKALLSPTLGAEHDDGEAGRFVTLPLAGYGNRQGRPAEGIHDDLWAKAVAFCVGGRTGVVVSADLLIIPREVSADAARRVATRCGVEPEALYFGATHSHSSLGGWGKGLVAEAFAGGFQPAVRLWMAHQLAEAAVSAVRDLTPATLGEARFQADDLVRNRLVGDAGRVDGTFALMRFRQSDGDSATVGSYAAHATVISGGSMQFGGDYPGYWQRGVESVSGGMALFLAGAVGSHAPRPPEGGVDGAKRMGEELARRSVEALSKVETRGRAALGWATLVTPLPLLQPRITDGWRVREWVARRFLPVGSESRLQALRIGSSVWLSTPCDYSGELALELKEATADLGLQIAVTSFNGDYLGYVVPARYYGMNTYETRVMAFFGPQLPFHFDGLLKDLVRRAAREAPPAASPP
jgi:neutral ceramidase